MNINDNNSGLCLGTFFFLVFFYGLFGGYYKFQLGIWRVRRNFAFFLDTTNGQGTKGHTWYQGRGYG